MNWLRQGNRYPVHLPIVKQNGPSCNTTNIADTTGAVADETTPVNNDSVYWDRVIDRVFHEHCSFMNEYLNTWRLSETLNKNIANF